MTPQRFCLSHTNSSWMLKCKDYDLNQTLFSTVYLNGSILKKVIKSILRREPVRFNILCNHNEEWYQVNHQLVNLEQGLID